MVFSKSSLLTKRSLDCMLCLELIQTMSRAISTRSDCEGERRQNGFIAWPADGPQAWKFHHNQFRSQTMSLQRRETVIKIKSQGSTRGSAPLHETGGGEARLTNSLQSFGRTN